MTLPLSLGLHRAEIINPEGGMAGGTGILMAASSGTTTITADTGPYRWICTASHGLETSNGTTGHFYILLMPQASV